MGKVIHFHTVLTELGGSQAGTAFSCATGEEDWTELVERVQGGDDSAREELYRIFAPGIRFFFRRQLGPQDLDDRILDTLTVVFQSIERGQLRDPERLPALVRTILNRRLAAYADYLNARKVRRRRTLEQSSAYRQKVGLMKIVLEEMPERDREVLTRFYENNESEEQICSDMNLSEIRFRLLQSQVKTRFGILGRKLQKRDRLSILRKV